MTTTGRKAPQREKPQLVADEVRAMIVAGELSEGDSLGHEADLVERFGVSRPSLREALRILEAEGLITVVRGVHGGVVVHEPDQRMTARSAALVLQTRHVTLADVFETLGLLEPIAAKAIASQPARRRRSSVAELRAHIEVEEASIADPERFGPANAAFHERLVGLAGNQTLTIVAEMLNEVVARAVTAVSQGAGDGDSIGVRQRGIRSQSHLVALIEAGADAEAEDHWRSHMQIVGRVMLGQQASTVVDLLHY